MNTTTFTPGTYDRRAETARIEADWAENPRWTGICRSYTAEDVVRLRGSLKRDNTIAGLGAGKLWQLLTATDSAIDTRTARTGSEAVQHVETGARAIYLPDPQTVGGATTETLHPDQSLYALNSIPSLVRRINNAFERADQVQWKAGTADTAAGKDYFIPIIADAEAHSDGALNAFELMKNMIRAGAAGVCFDDRLPEDSGVLIPTSEAAQKLNAARLAADTEATATLIVARTAACTCDRLSGDSDPGDRPFIRGEREEDSHFRVDSGIEHAIARALVYAAYADVVSLETARLDMEEARRFATAIRDAHPGTVLAYRYIGPDHALLNRAVATFADCQSELAEMGYRLQLGTRVEAIGAPWEAHAELAA